ncbi:acyl-[ACP]--phospholipid O-acyltransferase [Kaistia geumhonensis]|uniref:Acyl-[acyl-carrier-protein]-phospholipid O-acyltransferase/long-chain-fatty-acid--[acyl-carrier-protein] ligase n=1 Tax=Kaistia geumhonensis TaxID=410839 RepID=A0ABU0M267_9HYPH|nr:acyl-[ACP]--phospholipid O-acyltransferase [Kaistia geumhonensis]MCX5479732.1 acyl-[ACP]--phospholipid O-acyltransferase [Kaistia geumhonensis]MDQ0515044.1 acyl-[acyl-carrier-protein]-phospholipid O-acyltransferase/long-chain-fatty-acid--[acyl-carrier-protein] ligase [Kaistia geumhonensis]
MDAAPSSAAPPSLLRTRGFLPLFIVQWFGAFADNALKSAFGFMVAYGGADLFGLSPQVAVTLGGGVFMLPFFLFSGISGRLSDSIDKRLVVRWTRVAEVILALVSSTAIVIHSAPLALFGMFLYAVQSTIFGPAKYSILPQLVERQRLVAANALFEGSTFVAILLGTLFGGLTIGLGGTWIAVAGLVGAALAGAVAAFFVPPAPPAADAPPFRFSFVEANRGAFAAIRRRKSLFLAVLGISWFWMIGLVVMSLFPEFAKSTLRVDEVVANLLVAAFVVGIALGSAATSKLLGGHISARHTPIGGLIMALFMIDLARSAPALGGLPGADLLSVVDFATSAAGLRVLLDLVGIAFGGGLFTVPLYALLQSRAAENERSAAIAGNNIMNAALMVGGTIVSAALLAAGVTTLQLLFWLGIANIGAAIVCLRLIPDEVIKAFGHRLLQLFFGARVEGLENYGEGEGSAVVVVNHTSFLDAVLIGCLLPGRPVFAINRFIADRWWVKPAFRFFDLVPVDPTSPFTVRTMVKLVKEGRRLVIFPEGRITVTGALMKVYDGPAMIAALAGVPVIPLRIAGAQYSIFSRLKGKVKRRLFPRIHLTVLPPRTIELPAGLVGRRRRAEAGAHLQDIMTGMVFSTSEPRRTLFESLVHARSLNGARPVLEDVTRSPVGYREIIRGAFALGRPLAKRTSAGERVGVLLPNTIAAVVTFFALQAGSRVPAMLNFSAGPAAIDAARRAAELKLVVTSRQFVEKGRLQPLIGVLAPSCTILYLEDLRDEIGPFAKLLALIGGIAPLWLSRLRFGRNGGADDEAVVLFTSGSEGLPKGVSLSHAAIEANRQQISSVIDFSREDVVLNALPLFHAFGLTAGCLLPLYSGVRQMLYPSPLHYRIVPEIAYDVNATILFGTDTFLAGYARMAHPYDFYSVRYIFAGAEAVKAETRRLYSEKFGLRILEGYGTTETAPVIAINTPMANRPGSVGRVLPGIELRLEPVAGIEEGGRLLVRGPNVMRGYLRAEAPGRLEPPAGGWYDTGDIVTVDGRGFVTIAGRAKRFAKVGGEMVSLAAIETLAGEFWPDHPSAATAVPHERKGEEIVLVTERPHPELGELQRFGRAKGFSEIQLPKSVVAVERLPLLGSGKVDLGALRELALSAQAGEGGGVPSAAVAINP